MKIKLFTSVMIVIIFLSSFVLINKNNYQIECVGIENDGYISVNVWDVKLGSKYKIEQAQKDAIHSILYSGISSSKGCSSQPPILNDINQQANFKGIEKKFFSKNGNWRIFTKSSTIEIANSNTSNAHKIYKVTIAKNELRKYLESKNIIHSLTNGF